MKQFPKAAGLKVTIDGDRLVLGGDLTRTNGVVLEQWIHSLPAISVLDLAELDIEDGVAATHMVNAVRLLCGRVPVLQIVGAPQVLAHNLYRTGLLARGGIELKAMREDEAYG